MLNKTLLLFVVLFALLSSYSLFHSGLPPTHDGEYHVVRFYEFYRSFFGGSLYPRWAPDLNLGYGVPLFTYVYPFPNYVSVVTHLFGFSFIDSFKLNLLLATLIGAIFMYLWVKNYFGELSGFVASIFYMFSPYRFVDVYVRGSVGEVWAMAFLPALVWAAQKSMHEKGSRYFALSSIFFALIIISHNILALLFSIFFIAYSIVVFKNLKLIKKAAAIFIFGLSISVIFWLPALLEKSSVVGLTTYNVKENFVELYQLIIPSWGTGFSGGNLNNQMSFQVGIVNLTVVFIALFLSIRYLKRKNLNSKIVIFFLISFFTLIFLMTSYSSFVWDVIPLFNYFQFPWRLLSLVIIICSFLAGAVLSYVKNKSVRIIVALILLLSVLVSTAGYIKIPYYLERRDSYYLTRPNFIDGTNSIGNAFNTKWFNNIISKPKSKLELPNGGGIKILEEKPTLYKYNIVSKAEGRAVLNVAYFPGWAIYINGLKQKTIVTDKGLISFTVKKGSQSVLIRLESTPVEKVAALITLASIFFAGVIFSTDRIGIIKRKL